MSSQFMGVFSIGTTLDRGLRLYKMTIGKVFPILIIPMFIGFIPYFNTSSMLNTPRISPLYIIVTIINFFVGTWAGAVIIRYMQRTIMGETISASQMLKLADGRDFLSIFSYLIWGLLSVVSLFLLIIPFFYFANIMLMGWVLIFVERRYFFDGISRAFFLVKKRWWKTFAINFISFLIMFVPMIIAITIFSFVSALALKGGTSSRIFFLGGMVIYGGVIALVAPIFTSIVLVHYNSLRCEKESMDLEKSINEIGEARVQEAPAAL